MEFEEFSRFFRARARRVPDGIASTNDTNPHELKSLTPMSTSEVDTTVTAMSSSEVDREGLHPSLLLLSGALQSRWLRMSGLN